MSNGAPEWESERGKKIRSNVIKRMKQVGGRKVALDEVLPEFLRWARSQGWDEERVNMWRAWLTVRITRYYKRGTPGRKRPPDPQKRKRRG